MGGLGCLRILEFLSFFSINHCNIVYRLKIGIYYPCPYVGRNVLVSRDSESGGLITAVIEKRLNRQLYPQGDGCFFDMPSH